MLVPLQVLQFVTGRVYAAKHRDSREQHKVRRKNPMSTRENVTVIFAAMAFAIIVTLVVTGHDVLGMAAYAIDRVIR